MVLLRKFLSVLLVCVLFIQVVPVFASENQASNDEPWWEIDAKNAEEKRIQHRMSDEEAIASLKEIVKEQLDAQNASEDAYEYFYNYIEDNFAAEVEGISIQSTVRMPRGGETFTEMYSGNLYAGTNREQLLPPTVTSKIIQDYQDAELTTWQDVLTAMIGFALSSKYPVMGYIIGFYGVSAVIDDYMTSETIRQIRASTGASKIITYNSSYTGENTVWVPWRDYPYIQVPVNDQYHRNSSHTIY